MWVLLGTVFVASLLGSLHCVGMCGPFALLASSDKAEKKFSPGPAIAYSLGRLVTYSIVGLLAGTLGLALNLGTSFNQWQQSATYIAGALMILVGLVSLARWFGWQIPLPQLFRPLQKFLGHGFAWARQQPPVTKALFIGALTSLMPCGWMYTFAIAAAGTGSPLWGAALMIAFWVGTVPILLGLALGANRIGASLQTQLPALMAILAIAVGVFTILIRAPVAIASDEKVTTDTTSIANSIQNIDHENLPCCSTSKQDHAPSGRVGDLSPRRADTHKPNQTP